MAQEFLNQSQVSPAVEQMRGEAVAQSMGTHLYRDSRSLQVFFDDARNASGRDPLAS